MNKLALTEKRNPETVNIDLMDSWQIAKTLNNEDKKVALAVEKALPQIGDAIEVIAEAFRKEMENRRPPAPWRLWPS